jgi:NADH-quinone oxidoreductase subunit G
MVNVEIDGKKIRAREGAMVIEAADEAGIYIPRFCYHKKLSIAANCRMCLVEVEKVAKALPACATPVTDGMKIFTRSAKAIAAQKGVMEFLLINHPLDCPICDQGGECELQDIAMGYGSDVSVYAETKRVVPNKDFGPLIAGDMTRCIHCTRCVRFGDEIAGLRELGATGRGEHMEIGTYVQLSLNSEMSGNVIDLCPVGALTAKPSRYKARAWEMVQRDSVAPHDCIGSNLHVHVRHNEVVRVVPRENEEINETWLSDRDRFAYEGLNSGERLQTPMIKVDGEWQQASWENALHRVVEGFNEIKQQGGAEQLGALVSPSATVEELYLSQKLLRALGSDNIDHRLAQVDFADEDIAPAFPWLGQSIQDLERNDAVLLVGSNVRKDQPIAGHRLRKAALQGAKILCVNPVDYDFNFPVAAKCISAPVKMVAELGAICKAMLAASGAQAPAGLAELLAAVEPNAIHADIAKSLQAGKVSSVIMGPVAMAHPEFASVRALATLIGQLSDSRVGYLSEGGNSAGAWLAGAVPHRGAGAQNLVDKGKNLGAMLRGGMQGLLMLGVEPELDCVEAQLAAAALEGAKFVTYLTAFDSPAMRANAQVLLPIAPFTETSGTFVNAEGRWQSFEGVVAPKGEARPAWKVLRVLGNLFGCSGFEYVESQQIRDEVKQLVESVKADNSLPWRCPPALHSRVDGIVSIVDRRDYACDPIVRRAMSLQAVERNYGAAIRLNLSMAERTGLAAGHQAMARQDDAALSLPVVIDERVPDDSVLFPSHVDGGVLAGAKPTTLTSVGA